MEEMSISSRGFNRERAERNVCCGWWTFGGRRSK